MDKRSAAVSALITAALVAVLSGGSAVAEQPANVTQSVDSRRVQVTSPSDRFLVTVRGITAASGTPQKDADLIASGKSICADIDAGATSATFTKQIKDYGLNVSVYRVLIRESIAAFCPQHAGVGV